MNMIAICMLRPSRYISSDTRHESAAAATTAAAAAARDHLVDSFHFCVRIGK